MTRHKRRQHLSPRQKAEYSEAAERFHRALVPMFRDLVPTGEGYRALHAISAAISAAYDTLDVEKPERLCGGPLRTMEGHEPFPGG